MKKKKEEKEFSQPEKRRFNSYQRPYSYKQINDFFKQRGIYGIKVVNESGNILFEGTRCANWEGKIIPITKIKSLTFGQWEDEVDYFIYENKDKE